MPPMGYSEEDFAAAVVPNSGYSGAESQWDQMHYLGEAPTYQDPAGCIGGGCRDSDFTPLASTSQGVALMNRNRAHSGTLSTDVLSGLGRQAVFSSADLPFQIVAAYDEVVEAYLGRDANNYDWVVQGGFRGLGDWVSSGIVDSASRVTEVTSKGTITHGGLNSFFDGDFIGLDWADRQTARYGSEFDSAELCLVLRPHPRCDRVVLYPNGQWQRERQPGALWSFLGGVRYFHVDEGFTFRGAGTYSRDDGGTITEGLLSGTYFAHTNNQMVGLLLGTELTYRERGWELGGHFKASPVINTVSTDSRIDTTDPIFGDQHASFRYSSTRVAAILELGFLGTYRLNHRLAIRGGYDIAWLTGVAFAPVQRPSANEVIATGTVFFQGLTLGMEYRR